MHSVHIALLAQDCLVCVIHVIHACALVVGVLRCPSSCVSRFLPRFTVLLPALPDVHLSAQREVHAKPLRDFSLGSVVTSDYVTPLTGYEPNQELNLADAEELDLTTTSDIYFQNTLGDISSYPNDPDVDDNELAEFLAVVVDRTGKPVEVRSNNDQFSCDIRNLKSAQSQFLLVTQPEMICQTGRSVQARIAEERDSSSAQIRTMLNEQRRTIIDEYSEKVLHHELLAAQAE